MTIPEEIKTALGNILLTRWSVIVFSFICLLLAYASVIYLGNNNPIEIELEEVIEAETGIKVNLDTPDPKTK